MAFCNMPLQTERKDPASPDKILAWNSLKLAYCYSIVGNNEDLFSKYLSYKLLWAILAFKVIKVGEPMAYNPPYSTKMLNI